MQKKKTYVVPQAKHSNNLRNPSPLQQRSLESQLHDVPTLGGPMRRKKTAEIMCQYF